MNSRRPRTNRPVLNHVRTNPGVQAASPSSPTPSGGRRESKQTKRNVSPLETLVISYYLLSSQVFDNP